MTDSGLFLGGTLGEDGEIAEPWRLKAERLRTHGVVVGMTGSGKTGLSLVLLEELVREGVPIIAIDPKGDLGSLGLVFRGLSPEKFAPWVEDGKAPQTAARWENGLSKWGLDASSVNALADRMDLRLFTPGSSAGRSIDVLGAFRRPSQGVLGDLESRRQLVSATVSGLLGLAGQSTDPVRDPAHVVLSRIIDDAWEARSDPTLEELVLALVDPPFSKVGVFPVDRFFPPDARMALAMKLNAVLASPAFAAWRQGDPMQIDDMLRRPDENGGRVPVNVVSIAHLGEQQRRFLLSILLGRLQAWSRRQPGTEGLRAIVYFDEVAGYLPPHPKNPPTKTPLLTLMKQARAVGVGVVLCTQNPVDLDYKALSNAGTWMIGRLQTAQDRARLLKGIGRTDLDGTVQSLAKRRFVVHVAGRSTSVIESRHAMCYLRGPLTGVEIRRITTQHAALSSNSAPAHSGQSLPPLPAAAAASSMPPLPTYAASSTPPPVPVYAPPPVPGEHRAPPPISSVRPPSPHSMPPPVPSGYGDSVGVSTQSRDDGLIPAPPPVPGSPMWLDPRVAHSARLSDVGRLEPRRADGAMVWRPALHLDVRLRFDEARVGFVLDEHHHRVWFPLGAHGLSQDARRLDLQPSDLLPAPPPGLVRYELPPEWCDEERERKTIEKQVVDAIYRTESRGMFVHRKLKVHGTAGESEADFKARCLAAAENKSDAAIEKLQDRARRAVDRIEEKIARTEQRIVEQEGVLQGRKAEEMVGIGETVLSMFVGRRRSLSTAVGRRSRTRKSQQHLEGMEDQLVRMREEAMVLQDKLAADISDLRAEWEAIAEDGVERKDIRLARRDIAVARFGVLWIPCSQRV